jgi:hypothetical protein
MEIDSLSISDNEKDHLKSLAESHIHHNVLDSILSELSEDDKKTFLHHIESKHQENIWTFLNSKIEDVEEKVREAANVIKRDLLKDVREAKGETRD